MRNLLLFSLFSLFTVGQISAQTIVGTTPENKNVVLEEFTGIHCTFCPDGHTIAQGIQDQHPSDVILINIHQGSFATPSGSEPDFRTPWGDAIANQTGLTGYPSGTVNRHLFSGSNTAMNRGSWSSAANLILGQASFLNVGSEAFCTNEGELTVNVEVYYTGDSPTASNFLNVAILQSNITGPQTGGGVGNNYQHMHMLRHLITGQWGEEITETSEGTLFTTTLTYQIPAEYNDVPVILEDLDIVAFVSESHQEIISGIKADLTFEAAHDYDVTIGEIVYPTEEACIGDIAPQVKLLNLGANDLTSASIEYSINGGESHTYEWTGNLEYTDTEIISLPAIGLDMEENNEFEITISNPNGLEDQNPSNNTSTTEFTEAVQTSKTIQMQLYVGSASGNQISWDLKDGNGDIIAEGHDYSNNDLITEMLPITSTDCYVFSIYDVAGDGFSGNGYLKMKDDGLLFKYITTELEDHLDIVFFAGDPTSTITNTIKNHDVAIFPNPTYSKTTMSFFLEEPSNIKVNIYNTLGSLVMESSNRIYKEGEQSWELDTQNFDEGIYFVNLIINNKVITKKIFILK